MNIMLKEDNKYEVSKVIGTFGCRHPFVAFSASLIGVPVIMLAVIFGCTTLIMYPISMMMGWV